MKEDKLRKIKNKIEEMIRTVGYPVAYKGIWDDNCIQYVVRGKDSFITLDFGTTNKGTIDIYREPLKLKRIDKKFFMATKGKKFFKKNLVSFGRGWVSPDKQIENYANIYKWLLQNKKSLGSTRS